MALSVESLRQFEDTVLSPLQEFEELAGRNMLWNFEYRKEGVLALTSKVLRSLKDKTVLMKTCKALRNREGNLCVNSRWEFDKQNDPKHRVNALRGDVYIFAAFLPYRAIPEFCIIVKDPESVKKISYLISDKQERFLQHASKKKSNPTSGAGRDTINISIGEIFDTFENGEVSVIGETGRKMSLDKLRDIV
jgi:hypothetical protein